MSQVLANRNFTILLASQGLGDMGSGLFTITVTWFVLEQGGPVLLGILATAQALPYLFFASLAGAICDRANLRRLVIASEGLSGLLAVVAPLLHWAGRLGPWTAIVLSLGIVTFRELGSMARRSLVPRLLPADSFLAASSLNNLAFRLAIMVSGALVGPLSRALGLINLLWLAGAALAADSLSCLALRPPQPPPVPAPARRERPGALLRQVGANLAGGFALARSNPYLRAILTMDGLFFTLGYGPMAVALPTLVKNRLAGDAGVLGLLQAVGAGAALVGAGLAGQFLGRSRRGRMLVLAWVAYGLGSLALAFTPSLPSAMIAIALQQGTGFFIPILGQTIIQEKVPAGQLGRAFGAWDTVAPGFGIPSAALAGFLARTLPPSAFYGFLGAISLGNAVLVRRSALWGLEPPGRVAKAAEQLAP